MGWTHARIEQMAEKLLHSAGVHEPPIPVERLARHCGTRLRYEPFAGELSGMLFRQGDDVIIGINALHAKTRQRFTIAHELGHLMLEHDEAIFVDRGFHVLLRNERSSQATDHVEIEANTFAAALLMPVIMLKRDLRGQTVDYEDDALIRRLADRYKVSTQAMTFRLINAGFIGLSEE